MRRRLNAEASDALGKRFERAPVGNIPITMANRSLPSRVHALCGLPLVFLLALPAHAAPAWPGEPLALYRDPHHPLRKTGGMVVPEMRPGYRFQVWETPAGREYRFSPSFRSPFPQRKAGYVYLPHTSLVVLVTPRGGRVVISERRSEAVASLADLQAWLANQEQALARAQLPPRTPAEQLDRWRRALTHEPYMELVYRDQGVDIYRGQAFGGKIGTLYLVPDAGDLDPDATGSVFAGEVESIAFARGYGPIVLEDLWTYADPARHAIRANPP